MSEDNPSEKTIVEELSKLGKQMAEALRTAWESEDRKKLQAEIVEGMQQFGNEVGQAARKANESDTAKQLKTQAEKMAGDVKSSEVTEAVRKSMIGGLEVLNQELGKLLERLETTPATGAPAEAATGEAGAPAATPSEPAQDPTAPPV
jgi:hypothetical protein